MSETVLNFSVFRFATDKPDNPLIHLTWSAAKSPKSDQSWFWTPEWQAKEAEANSSLERGRYRVFDDVEDFIRFLDSDDE